MHAGESLCVDLHVIDFDSQFHFKLRGKTSHSGLDETELTTTEPHSTNGAIQHKQSHAAVAQTSYSLV